MNLSASLNETDHSCRATVSTIHFQSRYCAQTKKANILSNVALLLIKIERDTARVRNRRGIGSVRNSGALHILAPSSNPVEPLVLYKTRIISASIFVHKIRHHIKSWLGIRKNKQWLFQTHLCRTAYSLLGKRR